MCCSPVTSFLSVTFLPFFIICFLFSPYFFLSPPPPFFPSLPLLSSPLPPLHCISSTLQSPPLPSLPNFASFPPLYPPHPFLPCTPLHHISSTLQSPLPSLPDSAPFPPLYLCSLPSTPLLLHSSHSVSSFLLPLLLHQHFKRPARHCPQALSPGEEQ